ncbi:MAG: DoxX family protein [Defluviimonas sp.]|uniref:DoxX family protein n=1 Tax=Albidovulum sp. TaxID=1872424 RepID=UPI001D866D5B|nr:DoxX family protein [Paracoccaceae bacterium]MCC0064515.1 DoxX family protein [Defluviimonas sp.]
MFAIYDTAVRHLDRLAPALLPTLARAAFAAVLLFYFWNSALTKLGDGPLGFLTPSDSAYFQIFPRAVEAAGYDPSMLGILHRAVATAGLWAEFLLPLLIVIGLLTRLASLGMIGFTLVQSVTDVVGHGVMGADLGRWFDGASDALLFDQRTLWVVLLAVPVFMGGGPLSADRLIARRGSPPRGAVHS